MRDLRQVVRVALHQSEAARRTGDTCETCTYREQTGCPGCRAAAGKMFWGECAVAAYYTGWPTRDIAHLMQSLEANGSTTAHKISGLGEGWMCAGDTSLACNEPARSVFMLHKADPFVCADMSELKRRFAGPEVLQYLLIDGEFRGAVCGHWRIGPHDVEDIIVHLPAGERDARRGEILDAVACRYHPPHHRILSHAGCVGQPKARHMACSSSRGSDPNRHACGGIALTV